jgi:putative ubiquitin-RnfH superfamily antitoxin RatB of RatAB toxin-antitoxin module
VLGTKGLAEPASYELQAKDRVELYRPLIADPKEVRRRRAEEAKAQKTS